MDDFLRPPVPTRFPAPPPLPTVRIEGSGELAAALPHLLGFRPEESVVLVGLGGAGGGRVGLTLRADIPSAELAAGCVRAVALGLASDRPSAAVLAVVSEAPDAQGRVAPLQLPHSELVEALVAAVGEAGVPVRDALLVRSGRWWSYGCRQPCCRPGSGTPLPGGVPELQVASVAAGVVVERSRAELAARIAPLGGAAEAAMAAEMQRVADQLARRQRRQGPGAVRERSWAGVIALLHRLRPGSSAAPPSAGELAGVVCALRDPELRDRALRLALGEDARAAEALWVECVRRVPPPSRALPATLLAVCAWLRGDGALAAMALARARESDPGYAFAALLDEALSACLPPAGLRELLVAAGSGGGAGASAGR